MVKCRSLKIIDYNNTALPHLSPVNHQICIFSAQVSRIKQSHMTWLILLQLKTCKLQEDKHMSPLLGPECLEASLGSLPLAILNCSSQPVALATLHAGFGGREGTLASPASLVAELGGLGLPGSCGCEDCGGRAWPQLAANP